MARLKDIIFYAKQLTFRDLFNLMNGKTVSKNLIDTDNPESLKKYKIYYHESNYKTHMFWSTEDKPVTTGIYFRVDLHFSLNKEGFRYSISTPNLSWCEKDILHCLHNILVTECMGRMKYDKVEEKIEHTLNLQDKFF